MTDPRDLSAAPTLDAFLDRYGRFLANCAAALAEIDPVQAAVFCLVCLDGLANRDAAAVLGVTANHAGVLLHRGRQALREKLTAFDPAREGNR